MYGYVTKCNFVFRILPVKKLPDIDPNLDLENWNEFLLRTIISRISDGRFSSNFGSMKEILGASLSLQNWSRGVN